MSTFDADVHLDCLNHIRDTLLGLTSVLEELRVAPSEVKIRRWPWSDQKIWPGITIYPDREEFGVGTCSTDDIGYGCAVSYVRSSGKDLESNLNRPIIFRSEVRSRFHNQPIPVACVFTCKVEYGGFLMPKRFAESYDVSSLLIRCWNEEERQ